MREDSAHFSVPHLFNDEGVAEIRVGAKAFKCIGASPPFDHPHIYLNMGSEDSVTCPYCSTRYIYDPDLPAGETIPKGALYSGA